MSEQIKLIRRGRGKRKPNQVWNLSRSDCLLIVNAFVASGLDHDEHKDRLMRAFEYLAETRD